jgi:hypothetical protein
MTFERKIMRKIYGPTRTADSYWKMKINQEINGTLKGQSIIGFINPLLLLFKALLHWQNDCVFFSRHLNLRTKPDF